LHNYLNFLPHPPANPRQPYLSKKKLFQTRKSIQPIPDGMG